ncbi:carboxypeptidase-like regulatory domain-containing protein [Flaviaesturariibacter amylovorans]|uniref:Carboxypeptidase regulatory-like domain-containing protein n=1 Tax=Flaviaesturariibacter amylovorans TaxID=1084520 RepID=A0ABP8GIH3_9BACT
MRLKRLLPVLLLAASCTTFGIIACRKSDSISLPGASATVTTTLTGRIVDENRNPVSGAVVKAGAGSATTDVNGEFTLSNVSLSASAAFVKVDKEGYFTGSRTLSVSAGTVHYVSIELAPRRIVATFSASSGGTVPLDAGGSLQFGPNAIMVDAGGAPYNGTVRVAAYTYDPTAANFNEVMPGALRAINNSNEERLLKSYAMSNIELLGTGGEKLQLAPGKTATLTLAIPAGLQNTAPATIPLWYFDETKGFWIEEGSGTRQGNTYVGTVSHFTPWNYDVPIPMINLDLTVVGVAGTTTLTGPIPGARVDFRSSVVNGTVFTNSNGKARVQLAANDPIEIRVYDRCGQVIHTATIGPYTANATHTASINNYSGPSTATFTGIVRNCNGQPVVNGYVNVLINGTTQRAVISNGSFSFRQSTCGTSVQALLTPVDLTANVQGAAVSATAAPGGSTSTTLSACGPSSTQFMQFLFNNQVVRFQPPADSLAAWTYASSQETFLFAVPDTGSAQQHAIGLQLRGAFVSGTHLVHALDLMYNHNPYSMNSASAQISSFGPVNGFIEGYFSGTVRDSLGLNTYPVSGSFKIRRDN